jgi:predicted enzyme related to lactoylglutathione lyase
MVEGQMPAANECGFAHIAFAVDDVDQALEATIAVGGSSVGDIATTQVDCWRSPRGLRARSRREYR